MGNDIDIITANDIEQLYEINTQLLPKRIQSVGPEINKMNSEQMKCIFILVYRQC